MATYVFARNLIGGLLVSAMALAGCSDPSSQSASRSSSTQAASELADAALREQAAIMQKTILEGAIAGAAVGGGISIGIGGDQDTVRLGTLTGLGVGAAAGTYVAYVQRRYANKERRLREIKEDLDTNAQEMQQTIAVMQKVLAEQQAELRSVRAQVNAGRADTAALSGTVTAAQANLTEMQRAIDGAASRQAEFDATRGLVPVSGGTSALEPELARLSSQVSTMRAIAADLETELGS